MDRLIPLHVTIGLKGNRQHDFPDFNKLPKELRGGADWAYYVDRFGGWHYDHECGHDDHDPVNGTPAGQWCGMLLVPVEFAEAAVAMFPDTCKLLNEADAEWFYNERAHAHEPDIKDDVETLQAIAARKALGIDDPGDANALDPDHPAPGRRRNKRKTWQQYKANRGIELDDERLRDGTERKRPHP